MDVVCIPKEMISDATKLFLDVVTFLFFWRKITFFCRKIFSFLFATWQIFLM